MKNGFYDDIRLFYLEFALRRQPAPELTVARLLVPLALNR
jgi:hypothetical protein